MLPTLLAAGVPAAVCGVLLLPRAAAAQGGPDEIERPEVARLRFVGVKAVDQAELEKSISTTASHCKSALYSLFCAATKSPLVFQREYLDRAEFRRDVLRIKVFYFRHGYRETQVDTTVRRVSRDQVAIRVRITEGEPTRLAAVTVTGADSIVPPKIKLRRMLLKPGSVLDLSRLDSSVVRLYESLWNAGYADAKVDTALVVDRAARTATLAVTLTPNWLTRVGSVTVVGNRLVATGTIRNSLTIKPGDVYKRDDVVRSQRALYESSLFRRALIGAAGGDSIKAVKVEVTEAPLHEAQASVGANTFEFVQTSGRFTAYNFTGGARRLDLRGAVGNLFASGLQSAFLFKSFSSALDNGVGGSKSTYLKPTWQLSADLTQPYVGSPLNTLSAGVFASRRAAPGVYVDQSEGATGTFTRQFREKFPTSLTYRFEVSKIAASQVYFCVNYGACDLPTADLLAKPRKLSPLALVSSLDRTNDPFNPSSGFRAQGALEHASTLTASDYRYNRASGEAAVFRPFGKRVIAAHLRVGYVGAIGASTVDLGAATDGGGGALDVLHPRKRFYAGGSQSVRGFGENQLGPRVLTIDPNSLRGKRTVGTGPNAVTSYRCLPSTPIEQCSLARSAPALDANGVALVDSTGQPVLTGLSDDAFTPRPTGGTTLVEGSVEFRFPLMRIVGQQLGGALFVDAGSLRAGGLGSSVNGAAAVTPGVGVRYASPVGAVRVDVGYQPSMTEKLCAVSERQEMVTTTTGTTTTTTTRNTGALVYVGSAGRNACSSAVRRAYAPLDGKGPLAHLVLHLSIGQAF